MDTQFSDWTSLSPEEKKLRLYQNQKETLDDFLQRGAISPAQYKKSLGDLSRKMGINTVDDSPLNQTGD